MHSYTFKEIEPRMGRGHSKILHVSTLSQDYAWYLVNLLSIKCAIGTISLLYYTIHVIADSNPP